MVSKVWIFMSQDTDRSIWNQPLRLPGFLVYCLKVSCLRVLKACPHFSDTVRRCSRRLGKVTWSQTRRSEFQMCITRQGWPHGRCSKENPTFLNITMSGPFSAPLHFPQEIKRNAADACWWWSVGTFQVPNYIIVKETPRLLFEMRSESDEGYESAWTNTKLKTHTDLR